MLNHRHTCSFGVVEATNCAHVILNQNPRQPPCWLRAALPCPARAPPCWPRVVPPCPRTALPHAVPPCPARAPSYPARAPLCRLPRRPALPARHPAGRRAVLPCPRAALLYVKHIALRYFLARELQQRGQLRLAYVATRANTADIFTKALQSGDHQRFCTVLGIVSVLPHLLTA
ncbi:unnamed protein product [Closterium sp. NIES-53]